MISFVSKYFFLSLCIIASGQAALAGKPVSKPKINTEVCRHHIAEEEKCRGIDAGLLEAIAQIESKLTPYTVNASGLGYSFKNLDDAVRFIKTKQQEGCQNISVGPMQLHLPSHRRHFKSLEEMFEPQKNIRYAAKLLARFKRQTGSTEKAVKMYHTGNQYAGEAYKNRVFGAWAKIRKRKKMPQPFPVNLSGPTDNKSSLLSRTKPSSKRVKIKFGTGAMAAKKD